MGHPGRFDLETHRAELPVNDKCQCCLALSDRIMELEGIASPLSAGFGRVRNHFELTVREASLLMALLRFKRTISKDELMTLAYPVEDHRPELKIIDVFICKLRKKLPAELCPKTDWGMGYYLDSAARRALQAIAGAGEQSDGGEESDTIIDFRRVRAAALNALAIPVPTVSTEAVQQRLEAIEGETIDAGQIRQVQRSATDILGGLAR